MNRQYRNILLLTLVTHASGRPGPEIVSAEFIGRMRATIDNGGLSVTGYNDSPQSARLEMGFVGIDSLGRHYAQPPYPWARPSLIEVGPQYRQALQDEIPRWLQ